MEKIDGISLAVAKSAAAGTAKASEGNGTRSVSGDAQRAEGVARGVADPLATERAAAQREVVDEAAVEQALEEIREMAQRVAPQLKFENDRENDVVVIKVLDRVTGEVIRQLPPEAVVDARAKGLDGLPSLIADFA